MSNNNLRALRKRAGYDSVSAFAAALGRPLSTVTSHENGNRDITERYLKIYSEFLNVSPETILRRDTLIVHDKLLDVISAFCAVQKRHPDKLTTEFISNALYEIERNNVEANEMELFIESCLLI